MGIIPFRKDCILAPDYKLCWAEDIKGARRERRRGGRNRNGRGSPPEKRFL
jgi:hypothetical protein